MKLFLALLFRACHYDIGRPSVKEKGKICLPNLLYLFNITGYINFFAMLCMLLSHVLVLSLILAGINIPLPLISKDVFGGLILLIP